MPRKARELSATGIHHIWIRGINQQRLFEEDADYEHFLSLLEKTKYNPSQRDRRACRELGSRNDAWSQQ